MTLQRSYRGLIKPGKKPRKGNCGVEIKSAELCDRKTLLVPAYYDQSDRREMFEYFAERYQREDKEAARVVS